MKINYIIATWSGKQWINSNGCGTKRELDSNSEQVLRIHLEHLLSLKHTLTQITIVKPDNPDPQNVYPEYYNIDDLLLQFTCKVEWLSCKNFAFSYGQWLKAYRCYKNEFDYYIFVEDDTVANLDYFDQKLVSLYKSQKSSYLCGLASSKGSYPHHAMISYGIISSLNLEDMFSRWDQKPLEQFGQLFRDKKYLKKKNVSSTLSNGCLCQIEFSLLFTLKRLSIDDYLNHYPCIYWKTNDSIKDVYAIYTRKHKYNLDKITLGSEMRSHIRAIIIPVQLINSKEVLCYLADRFTDLKVCR